MRRFLSILLAAALLLGALPALTSAAAAADSRTPIYNGDAEADYYAEAVLSEIFPSGTAGLSDRETIWQVYSWLMQNCARSGDATTAYLSADDETLDSFAAAANKKLAAGELTLDDSDSYDVMYAAYFGADMLVYRVGNCAHFSCALKLLLNHLGYASDVIWGEFQNLDGTTYEHKWNNVCIDGTWYWLDVRMDHANYLRSGTLSTQYFLISDTSAWQEEHIWDITEYPDKNNTASAAAETETETETEPEGESAASADIAGTSDIQVTVDGVPVAFTDAWPTISDENRTLLPIAAVTQAMGCSISWNGDTRIVRIDKESEGLTMLLKIDSTVMAVCNGKGSFALVSDCAPSIQSSRTYLPIRIVAEVFGYTVDWDSATRTVILQSGGDYVVTCAEELSTSAQTEAYQALLTDSSVSLPVQESDS